MSKYEKAKEELESVAEGWFAILDKHNPSESEADWAITGFVAGWSTSTVGRMSANESLELNRVMYERLSAMYQNRSTEAQDARDLSYVENDKGEPLCSYCRLNLANYIIEHVPICAQCENDEKWRK